MKVQANGGRGRGRGEGEGERGGGISVGNITTWHRGILAITTLPVPHPHGYINFSTLYQLQLWCQRGERSAIQQPRIKSFAALHVHDNF